ncbi:snRNA-activating protein complex subunit 4 [Holothuria leucospilota]|uniref:snRNA-activating protein complex subunit 4 n=1 Tax=Holothuria leucospilota TaxID=206669 RepID=A0A9Q1C5V6_HOLLE|nr:snRNA-activating protein complex subunit 4 [Holothuria leucospilota]
MELSSDTERQQLEEDIRQIDEALLHDNDGELYGSDLEGSRQSEDEAAPMQSSFDDDEAEDISQQPSTSQVLNKDNEFVPEGSSQEDGDSDDYDEEEPSMQQLLVLNRRYQDFLVSNLRKVQEALQKNRIMQAELLDNKKRDKEFPALPSKMTPPYFKDRNFLSPPSNEDTIAISKKGYPLPVHLPLSKTWTKQELNNLKKGVKADGLEKMMCPLLNQREIVEGKLEKAHEERDKQSRRALVKEISDIDVKLAELKVMPEERILGDPKRDVDWHKVANLYLEGNRTDIECQLKWQNHAHPHIQHDWTDEDEQLLRKIARVHGGKDWNTITSEMGRGFSAFECLQRYQQRLNDDLYKRPYTEEEDKLLVQLVEKFRIGDYIPWIKVAYFLKDRKDKQCSFRWQSKLNPSLKSGKWSDLEDKILLGCVKKHKGRDWTKIAQGVSGRCSYQCRNRWVNVLNPDLRRGRFSAVEDVILLESVKQCGIGHWTRIQTLAQQSPDFLPGRSQPMLMSRYRYLAQLQKEKLQKEFKVKRAQFRKNCMEHQMTSMIGNSQTLFLQQMDETFEEYCSKFTKEELLDKMIAEAQKRVTELGETAQWANIAGSSGGYSYEVNREAANKWKDRQRAEALAAKDFKDVKVAKPRMNTRHRRSETVLSTDVRNVPANQQSEQLDQQLVKAVFPCRTLQPDKFFEKNGRTVTRLSRSEYITSELNKKKPLTWSTAVLILMKASRVDVNTCKGIIHRSARLPNINILAPKSRNFQEAAKYQTLTTTTSRSINNRPFTMMLNKSNSSELVSGQVIGQLPGASESVVSSKTHSSTIHGARLSGTKKDLSGSKQSNPLYVMKTNDKRILLVAPGTSPGTRSPSVSGSFSPYLGGKAGSIYGATGKRAQGRGTVNGKTVEQRIRSSVTSQKRMNQVSDYVTIVATPPKRISSSGDKASKTGETSHTVQTNDPSFSSSNSIVSMSKNITTPVSLQNQVAVSESSPSHSRDDSAEGIVEENVTMTTGNDQTGTSTVQTSVISERPLLPKGLKQSGTSVNSGVSVAQLPSQQLLPDKVVVSSGPSHQATSSLPVKSVNKTVPGGSIGEKLLNMNTPGLLSGATIPAGASTVLLPPQPLVNPTPCQQPQTVMFLVRTASGPSSTLPVVTSTTTVTSQSSGQQTQLSSNPLLLTSSSVASQSTMRTSLVHMPSSSLHQNQVGCNPGGAIPSIQQMNETPGNAAPIISPPLRLPASGMSVTPSASPLGVSSLSSVTVPSTMASGIYQLAQNSTAVSLNTLAGTNQSLVLGALGTSGVASTNGQGSTNVCDGSGLGVSPCQSGSGLIFSQQLKARKLKKRKMKIRPDPYINPKMVIGVKNVGPKPSSVKVPSTKSSGGERDAIMNDENENYQKSSSGPLLPSNKPSTDDVHCGTGDDVDCIIEKEGNLQKKAKTSHGDVSEGGKNGSSQCADGIHCGTDDTGDGTVGGKGRPSADGKMAAGSVIESINKDSQPCSDGVHCGTDDEEDSTVRGAEAVHHKKAKLTPGSVEKSGKNESGGCSDGIHCGTDNEEDSTVREAEAVRLKKAKLTLGFVKKSGKNENGGCSGGIHCGTDDEEDSGARDERKGQESHESKQKELKESGKSCSDGIHCGTYDEADDPLHTKSKDISPRANVKVTNIPFVDKEKDKSKTCSDGVHCGTDDEDDDPVDTKSKDISPRANVKVTNIPFVDKAKDKSKTCSDGVHCGTDDEDDDPVDTKSKDISPRANVKVTNIPSVDKERDKRETCSDGIHCGTDDEDDNPVYTKSKDISPRANVKVTNIPSVDKEKDKNKTCSDGIHCGTDNEDENEGSRAGGTKSTQQTKNVSETEDGDGSYIRTVEASNKDGEVSTIQSGDNPNTRAAAAPGSSDSAHPSHGSGGTHLDAVSLGTCPGSGRDPAPMVKELGVSAKRPRRKAAPKPGSFVMSSTEEEDDSDIDYRGTFSKVKKLKSGQLDVTNQSPSVLKSSQVPNSRLSHNSLQSLTSSPVVLPGGSTIPSAINVGQMQLPIIENITPFIASRPTILVGPGNVIVGVLPGNSPTSQLPQNASVLPTMNTLPNVTIQQPLLNNTVVNNYSQQPNMLLQQPLGTTVNPMLITLPNATAQPPVSASTNSVPLSSISTPVLQQPGGTSVTVPSKVVPNILKGATGMAGSNQSPIVVSLPSTPSPALQSSATTVPNLFPLSSLMVPMSHNGGGTQGVIPEGQTSVNPVSNVNSVMTSPKTVKSLLGVRKVTPPTQLSSGVTMFSHAAVPSASSVPQQSSGLRAGNVVPPQPSLTTSALPPGDSVVQPSETRKRSPRGKKSAKSVARILKEMEKMKPSRKAKGGMLPQLMKEDQYTVNMDKLEEFSKNILGTPMINMKKEMPTLPPNLVTLFSFKHLLIKKISLEDKASKFSMTSGELHNLINSTGVTVRRSWLDVLAEDTPVNRQQFLTSIQANHMYTLFKERFTMLFLWPAFLSLLTPLTPRKRRKVVCQSKKKQKLCKEKERESRGKMVLLKESDATSELNELDKSVGEGEDTGSFRGKPRVGGRESSTRDASTNNSGKKGKKTVRKIISPQLPTRRGTRATPLRKSVVAKEIVTKGVSAVSESREEKESLENNS